MEKEVKKRKIDLSSYAVVISFLAMEVFAFVGFSLANSYILYSILGIVLALMLLVFGFKQIKNDGYTNILYLMFPLIAFGFLTLMSTFQAAPNIADIKILIPFTILAYSAIGYFLSLNKTFKLSTFFIVIYSTLAILTLINLFVTVTQFGIFYPFGDKAEYHLFYNGALSETNIGSMAYALVGFKFVEVHMSYFALYPVILLTSIISLVFISPKKDTKLFVLYCVYAFIAIIALLFTLSLVRMLVMFFVILTIGLVILYAKKKPNVKPLKICFFIALFIVVLGFISVFLNAQNHWSLTSGLRNFIANNAFLNKLYNGNNIFAAVNDNLSDYIVNGGIGWKFFGFVTDFDPNTTSGYQLVSGSGIGFVDLFMTSGVIGVLFIILAGVIGVKGLLRYFSSNDDEIKEKATLLGFVLAYIVYSLLYNKVNPLVFYEDEYMPMHLSGMFLIIISLLSYGYSKGRKQVKVEEVKNNEEVSI